MKSCILRSLMLVGVIMSMPETGYAQDATLSGTVMDTTGGVLPGVTVTALLEASGNTFVAVSDERGAYRIPVRIGVYRITAELAGFATVAKTMEVQVGQQAVMNFQMAPSGVQESVTVSGEAPLVQRTSSTLGGNIDSRQMEELPVNGRNFKDLALLAAGNADDFIQHRVLPYANQQLSTTFGGPIVKDKIHFFFNYEYEREPQTYTYSSIYPQFNIDQGGIHREKPMGLRLDFQFSPNTH